MGSFDETLSGWIRGESNPAPVTQLVGIQLVSVESGAAVMQMATGERHYNPLQTVHGGILCDLADAAMGVAMASHLEGQASFTSLDLNIQFLRAVKETVLTANARVIHRTQRTAYLECEIQDEQGRLVAKASSRCLIR